VHRARHRLQYISIDCREGHGFPVGMAEAADYQVVNGSHGGLIISPQGRM
jgi:hypothetical protein